MERPPCCLLTRNLPTDHFFLLTSKIFCHFRPPSRICGEYFSIFSTKMKNAVQPVKSFLRWIRYSTGGANIIIHFLFLSSSNLTWQARLLVCFSLVSLQYSIYRTTSARTYQLQKQLTLTTTIIYFYLGTIGGYFVLKYL